MNILVVYENFIVMVYRMKCVVRRLFDLVEMNFLRRGSAFVHIKSHLATVPLRDDLVGSGHYASLYDMHREICNF